MNVARLRSSRSSRQPPRRRARRLSSATLFEIPLSTCRLPGLNVPISGGGYFRLYPYALTRALARRLHHQGLPLVFYVHPWEFDTQQPRIRLPRWLPGMTHYHRLGSTVRKMRQLLVDFDFVPMRDAFALQLAEVAGNPAGRLG